MLHPFLVVEIHTKLQLLGYRFPESKIFRRAVDKFGKIKQVLSFGRIKIY